MAFRALLRGRHLAAGPVAAAVIGLSTLVALPTEAHAGIAPDVYMSVEIRDTGQNTLFNSGDVNLQTSGVPIGPLGYQYSDPQGNYPALVDPQGRFDITAASFAIANDTPGTFPARLFENMTFENTSANTLEFIINYRLEMSTALGVGWTADSTWNLGGNGPGSPEVLTLPGMSLFTAYIDGAQVATQHDPPSGFGGSGGDLILEAPSVSGLHGPITQSLGIQLAFSLTPGGELGVQSSIIAEIPAPAAAPLLAIGGLFGTRRRRRS